MFSSQFLFTVVIIFWKFSADIRARRSDLGPVPDVDLEVDDRRPSQDLQQTRRILFATVQEQQKTFLQSRTRFEQKVRPSFRRKLPPKQATGSGRGRTPSALAKGPDQDRRNEDLHFALQTSGRGLSSRWSPRTSRSPHFARLLSRNQLQVEVLGALFAQGSFHLVRQWRSRNHGRKNR